MHATESSQAGPGKRGGLGLALGSAVAFDNLDGLTVLGVPRFGLTRSSLFVKRAFDLVGAGLTLLVFAPVMAAIAQELSQDHPLRPKEYPLKK